MVKELVKNQADIIALKKSEVKESDGLGLSVSKRIHSEAIKAQFSTKPNEILKYGDYIYPVINTTNILDSHGDVHITGLWNKSIKEQQGKTYLIINHDLSVGKVISQPKDVQPFTQLMNWADLGLKVEGQTEALIFKSKITERSNKDAFDAYQNNDPVEHSIRMQYVKMFLCISPDVDDDAEMAQYNENWEKYAPMVINQEDLKGYFWAITEAKIFKEGSMVLAGSNSITPTLYSLQNKNEPSDDDTQKRQAAASTRQPLTQEQINKVFNFKNS